MCTMEFDEFHCASKDIHSTLAIEPTARSIRSQRCCISLLRVECQINPTCFIIPDEAALPNFMKPYSVLCTLLSLQCGPFFSFLCLCFVALLPFPLPLCCRYLEQLSQPPQQQVLVGFCSNFFSFPILSYTSFVSLI